MWNKFLRDRMSRMEKWERQRCQKYDWANGEVTLEKNVRRGERSDVQL